MLLNSSLNGAYDFIVFGKPAMRELAINQGTVVVHVENTLGPDHEFKLELAAVFQIIHQTGGMWFVVSNTTVNNFDFGQVILPMVFQVESLSRHRPRAPSGFNLKGAIFVWMKWSKTLERNALGDPQTYQAGTVSTGTSHCSPKC